MKDRYTGTYRPIKYQQLIGETQREVCKALLEKESIPQCILFIGPSGVGKTVIGEILTRKILNIPIDEKVKKYISYCNCGNHTGVDFIREITETFDYLPSLTDKKVYFFDEIHRLSQQAQDCLLTPMEDLPEHVVIIGATTEERKILGTLKSRFSIHKLKSPSKQEFTKKAIWVLKDKKPEVLVKTKKSINLIPEVNSDINEIIDRSNGNIRMFDEFLQQWVEGSYVKIEDSEDDEFFGFWFIFKAENASVSQILTRVDDITDYDGMVVAMTRMAINTVRNNKAKRAIPRCIKIIEVFGDGLSPHTDPKISFVKKILRI